MQAFRILASVVLSLLFFLPSQIQAQPATAPQSFSVPFVLQDGGHIVVILTVNGEPMRALLDTGGERSEINHKRVHNYKPSRDHVIRIRQEGRVEIVNQWQGHVCLNDSMCKDVTLLEMPHEIMTDTDALIGADFLQQFASIGINYETQTVTFTPRE
jgi:hypothetical protein